MSEDVRGYRVSTQQLVMGSDSESIGVILGKACIDRNIPVTDVARYFEVSRQTVYLWFKGKCKPRKELREKIQSLVEKLSKQ